VGEIDAKAPARIATTEAGTEVPPSDPKEEVPSSNPPVLAPPTSTTPKVAPAPEKVAITRATPSRTEGVVNGEVPKTRVGKHNVISLLIISFKQIEQIRMLIVFAVENKDVMFLSNWDCLTPSVSRTVFGITVI
jgi:hypothetical protein